MAPAARSDVTLAVLTLAVGFTGGIVAFAAFDRHPPRPAAIARPTVESRGAAADSSSPAPSPDTTAGADTGSPPAIGAGDSTPPGQPPSPASPIAFLAASVAAPRAASPATPPDGDPPFRLPNRRVFPADDPWNRDISREPVDPNSAMLLAMCGPGHGLHPDFGTFYNGVPNGLRPIVVRGTQPRVPVRFDYAAESDPGPYPLPPTTPIQEGDNSTGDRHVIVVDVDNWKLYELWKAYRHDGGRWWSAGSGAVFDLATNRPRPLGWTSADAAGLPIFPGLVRYDEAVEKGVIAHALRFTCTRSRKGYVAPARHWATEQDNPYAPPMGMRVRLKAGVDLSGYPPEVRVILTALKKYGMLMADNGGPFFLSGVHDPRWSDENLGALKRLKYSDFEVVRMGVVETRR